MNISGLAKRYAEAFLSYAEEDIGFDRAVDEMCALKTVFREVPDLKHFFRSCRIPFETKKELIRVGLNGISTQTRQFITLLIERNRISEIDDIVNYVRSAYLGGKATNTLIKSSYMLSDEQIEAIKKKLEDKLKVKLRLFLQLDPRLLGGVQVIVGSKVFDGSVNTRMEELRGTLKKLKVG
jgi:F-type H+-transporting ATPase subunit delta